jgi:hypothetical protein
MTITECAVAGPPLDHHRVPGDGVAREEHRVAVGIRHAGAAGAVHADDGLQEARAVRHPARFFADRGEGVCVGRLGQVRHVD